MGFFKKKKPFDITTPIVNPDLKQAIKVFNLNKSEQTLRGFDIALKKASFLVLINQDQIKTTKGEGANAVIIEKGSIIKFLKTFDQNNDSFLPIFTDWNEIDLWVKSRDGIAGWIMTINEVFALVLKSNDKGLVINPCSDRWTMTKEQINTFISESLN
jgi:hypothetical protein